MVSDTPKERGVAVLDLPSRGAETARVVVQSEDMACSRGTYVGDAMVSNVRANNVRNQLRVPFCIHSVLEVTAKC